MNNDGSLGGLAYADQHVAEGKLADLRREAYDLLTSLELLNLEIDSAKLARFIQERANRLDNLR